MSELWKSKFSILCDVIFLVRQQEKFTIRSERVNEGSDTYQTSLTISPRLYWGHVHCAIEGLVRVDEGFLILSSDLVHEFMARKETLLCHPFGDQTVALWINDANNVTFFHDPRVYHEVTSLKPEFKVQKEICQTYLSLHGAYLHEMLTYWDIVLKENRTQFWIPSVEPLSDICPLSKRFDWRAMQGPPYGWEPKPCSLNPVWDIGEMHRGRNMM